MFPILFFVILLSIYLLSNILRTKLNILGHVLIFLYLISSICSIFYYQENAYRYTYINIFSYFVLFILIYISFKPVLLYNPCRYITISRPPKKLINIFSVFLILIFVPSALSLIISVMTGYKEMLLDMALVSEMYAEEALEGAQSTGRSFSNPLGVIRNAFSEIIVFWTFYYLTISKKNNLIVILLFISLLVPPLNSFANASRTQMLYWLLHKIICVIIFYPFYLSYRTFSDS